MSKSFEKQKSEKFANAIRISALRMVHRAQASHIGSCLSCADIVAYLYSTWLKVNPEQPKWPSRDRFILSKGHAGAIVYAALAEAEFFPSDWLKSYCCDDAKLAGHLTHHNTPGVELSSGSLGHGLPVGAGIALGAKRENKPYRTVVLLSDGELNEGSNWEAFLFAQMHNLDNLYVVVDYNKIQSYGRIEDVISLEPLAEKMCSMNWEVREVDGHCSTALHDVFSDLEESSGKPKIILAHTTKGKGVSYMEDKLLYHYRPPDDALLEQAISELEEQEN